MRNLKTALAFVLCSFLFAGSAAAQQHITAPSALRQAVADQTSIDQQNRAAISSVLKQPQVKEVAGRLGLSLTKAENAVSTLSSSELAQAATHARTVNADLAGGSSTIVISTTTLLLILIIIILLVK